MVLAEKIISTLAVISVAFVGVCVVTWLITFVDPNSKLHKMTEIVVNVTVVVYAILVFAAFVYYIYDIWN